MIIAHSPAEAQAHLLEYLPQIRLGEEVLIYDGGEAIAKLIPNPVAAPAQTIRQPGGGEALIKISENSEQPAKSKRVPGALNGKLVMGPDFDEWPEDMARMLGIID